MEGRRYQLDLNTWQNYTSNAAPLTKDSTDSYSTFYRLNLKGWRSPTMPYCQSNLTKWRIRPNCVLSWKYRYHTLILRKRCLATTDLQKSSAMDSQTYFLPIPGGKSPILHYIYQRPSSVHISNSLSSDNVMRLFPSYRPHNKRDYTINTSTYCCKIQWLYTWNVLSIAPEHFGKIIPMMSWVWRLTCPSVLYLSCYERLYWRIADTMNISQNLVPGIWYYRT